MYGGFYEKQEKKYTTENMGNGRESHLARHFIQAFGTDETTPEQAHEIGKKLAYEILAASTNTF